MSADALFLEECSFEVFAGNVSEKRKKFRARETLNIHSFLFFCFLCGYFFVGCVVENKQER